MYLGGFNSAYDWTENEVIYFFLSSWDEYTVPIHFTIIIVTILLSFKLSKIIVLELKHHGGNGQFTGRCPFSEQQNFAHWVLVKYKIPVTVVLTRTTGSSMALSIFCGGGTGHKKHGFLNPDIRILNRQLLGLIRTILGLTGLLLSSQTPILSQIWFHMTNKLGKPWFVAVIVAILNYGLQENRKW